MTDVSLPWSFETVSSSYIFFSDFPIIEKFLSFPYDGLVQLKPKNK